MRGPASGEPPVLKVKKDAEQELRYHYDRDERIALKRSPQRQRTSFFARLRGRAKSLLPVLLGLLAILLVVRLLTRDRSAGRLAGYELSLRAYVYEDAVLASVTVTPRAAANGPPADAAEAAVRFSTTTGADAVTIEPLGAAEVVVRGRLPYTGTERQVAAEVAIGSATTRLTAPVGKP